MKNTEFIPADFDAHGRLRLPLLFWCVLLLQARTWVLFLMAGASRQQGDAILNLFYPDHERFWLCLLYTSDAADDLLCVDLGGRRIIKKKKILDQSTSDKRKHQTHNTRKDHLCHSKR